MALKNFNSESGFSVGVFPTIEVVDRNGKVIANALNVSGLANLGSISNLVISGGTAGQFIATDGNGNLVFSNVSQLAAAGPTNSIQFNVGQELSGDANLTFDPTTSTLSATAFAGDAGNLSNVQGSNVVGEVAYANYASFANVTLQSTFSNATQFVVGNAQPNITQVGNLSNLNVVGAVNAQSLVSNSSLLVNGDATILGNLIVQGNAIYSNVQTVNIKDPIVEQGGSPFGTPLAANDQINRGTLLHYFTTQPVDAFMGWDSNASQFMFASNVSYVENAIIVQQYGNLRAQNFIGNGVGLTNIDGANVTGTVANATYSTDANAAAFAGNVTGAEQPNITALGVLSNLSVAAAGFSLLGDGATANYFVGDGANLTNLVGATVVGEVANANYATYSDYANTAVTVVANNQPNITSLGTLTTLTVTGEILSQTGANLGDQVIANYFVGNGVSLTSLTGANVTGVVKNANHAEHSNIANTVAFGAQPNITSVGTLTGLTVDGDISANIITGTLFVGNAASLTNINGANVSQVANANFATYSNQANNANYAGNVTIAAQPNITSLGNLVRLTVDGNIVAQNANLGNLVTANFFSGNGSLLSSITGANVTGTVANAAFAVLAETANFAYTATRAGTVTTNAQPNITSLGTLSTLNVTGNVKSGNANLGNLVTANFFSGAGNNLSNIQGANVTGEVAFAAVANSISGDNVTSEVEFANLATYAVNVTNPDQPLITTVGALTNLTVVGNISAPGNVTEILYNKASNIASSNAFAFNDTSNTLSVTGNVSVSNYLTRDSKSVPTFVSSATSPTNPQLGDQWYDTDNDVIYQYIYDGLTFAWVDISTGFINANTQATPDTLAFRTATGNIAANTFVGNGLYVTDATVTGNLIVSGNTAYVNVTTLDIKDPVIQLGNQANGAPLETNDGKDRGEVLHYYRGGSAKAAFIGWDNSNAEFAFGSNVALSENVVTFNELGNVRAGYFLGDGSGLTNINAAGAGITGNVVTLGTPTDTDLVSPGTVTTWETSTTVTDAIDDLNEAMENVRNNTYVKSVSFTGTPTAGGAGTTVTLTITSVGNPNRYDITWGDGTQSLAATSTTPTHVYATNVGSPYTITVRAYNNAGSGTGSEASFSRDSYITIYTANPVVTFGLYRASTGGSALSGSTLYASEGETVYLENTTTNTTGATVTYTINWGDGNTDTISSDSVAGGVGGGRKSHIYATGQNSGTGTKTITLTITSHSTATPSYIAAGPNSTAAIKVYDPAIGAPAGLGTKTITFSSSVGTSPYLASGFANNTGGATTYVAGVAVNRILTGSANSVTLTSYAYDGDSGTLAAYINGVDSGNIALTSADNSGTNGALILNSESDYNLLTSAGVTTTFLLSTYSPGLYKGLNATVSQAVSALSAGVNNLKLSHTTSGNTNTIEFVKDDVTLAPTVDLTNATVANATNGTYRYISGVPYYNTGSPTVTLAGANVYNWIGQTYQSTTTPFQIAAGTNDESTTGNVVAAQTKTYANLDGATTFLSGGIPKANTGNTSVNAYTVGSQSINVAPAGIAAVQTVKFLATNVNGTGAYATHSKKIQVFTATPSGFVEDSIACAVGGTNAVAKRIVIDGTGSTRAYNSATNYYTSGLWSGAQTIAGTDSAVVRWNALKHYATDLTAYLPAGPDLATGRSTAQYFFGAFSRTAKSSFTVTITGTIRGLYFAAPGSSIDTTSTLNGWLDASIAYNGSGVPGANGNGSNGCTVGTTVPLGTAISNQTYTITLGSESTTNSTGNQILFSIALNAGDTVTSWSFS